MFLIRTPALICWLATVLLTGCQTGKVRSSIGTRSSEPTAAPSIRNNCASLLYELVSEEKHLSKLLLVKRESDPLEILVKEISSATGRHADILETMAKQDNSLNLSATLLPDGEAATRKRIAKTKQDQLLHSSGAEFEFALLLTQVEALSYGSHLAWVAADSSSNNHQAEQLRTISAELQQLHGKVIRQLKLNASRSAVK